MAADRPSGPPLLAAIGSHRPSYIDACEAGRWSLYLRDPQTDRRFATRYRCGSWRHAGACATHNSHRIFARIAPQVDAVEPSDLLMLVLTIDRSEFRAACAMVDLGRALAAAAGLPPIRANVDARAVAYATLWRRWQSLRQALHRMADRMGVPRARWAMTIEAHRRGGWPHAHVLMHWPWLAQALRDEEHDCGRVDHRDANGWHRGKPEERCGARGCLRDWLSARAVACGWGRVLSIEVAHSARQAAGYIVKLTGESGQTGRGAVGELAKMSQVPLEAPRHFRRLRYSLRSGDLEPMLLAVRKSGLEGALCGQAADVVAAAIGADRDLVSVTDPGTGEVRRVSFLLARPPPDWGATVEAATLRHLEAAWLRLHGA